MGSDDSQAGWEPFRTWERVTAIFTGAAVLVAGIVATFVSTNTVGTGALIVVAAAILLVGIQGTPLVKLGGESANIQLESRKLIERVVDRVTEQASPELARPILEALSEEENRLGAYPRHVSGQIYTLEVQAALLRAGASNVSGVVADASHTDLTARYPFPADAAFDSILINVMLKYIATSGQDRTRRARDFRHQINRQTEGSRVTPLLVVVNQDISSPHLPTVERLKIVTWDGPQDDLRLSAALSELTATELAVLSDKKS